MCTAVVRYAPGDAWPVLVAFVRDEDRARAADAPGAWWPDHPLVVGGRDRSAGGTWFAVDPHAPAAAFVTNRFEPGLTPPMQRGHHTRGTVALELLDADHVDAVDEMAPFHAVRVRRDGGRWWHWDGSATSVEDLAPGVTVIASRGPMLPGETERRARLAAQFAALTTPPLEGDSSRAWGEWIAALDGRATEAEELGALTVRSLADHPGFGTVGASLVALAADGRVRYDVNPTTDLDPGAWARVDLTPAGAT